MTDEHWLINPEASPIEMMPARTSSPGGSIRIQFESGYRFRGASLVAQMVKNPPAMRETWVRSLGKEGPLEESMGTHSSVPPWRIPWTEEPGGLQSMGSQRVRHHWATKHTYV